MGQGNVRTSRLDVAPIDAEVDLLVVAFSVLRAPAPLPPSIVALDEALHGAIRSLRSPREAALSAVLECRLLSDVALRRCRSSVLLDVIGHRGFLRLDDFASAGQRAAEHAGALRAARVGVVIVEPDTAALGSTRADVEAAYAMAFANMRYRLRSDDDVELIFVGSVDGAPVSEKTPASSPPSRVDA